MNDGIIISLDWLQISGLADPEVIAGSAYLKPLHLHNPIFQHCFAIIDDDISLANFYYMPRSSMLPSNLFLMKLDNALLYSKTLPNFLKVIFEVLQLHDVAVSRLDVCADFQKLYKINNISELYLKLQAKEFHYLGRGKYAVFGNVENAMEAEYIRFGKRNSVVCKYLYNKTLELKEVHNKQYIKDLWNLAGFDEKKDVYRLEFSLKPSQMENSDNLLKFNSLELILNLCEQDFLNELFLTLYNSYFKIAENIPDERPTRCPKINILNLERPISITRTKIYRQIYEASAQKQAKALAKTIFALYSADKSNYYVVRDILFETAVKEHFSANLIRELAQFNDIFVSDFNCFMKERNWDDYKLHV